jgi:hypothetical protein
MKCQACDQPATHHVTDIVAGQATDYHVCAAHLQDLDALEAYPGRDPHGSGFAAICCDPDLGPIVRDSAVRQELAAHVLPALCLALLSPKPEVRVAAAFLLMQFGADARSAGGALRDALADPDERVARAARIAVEYVEHAHARPG